MSAARPNGTRRAVRAAVRVALPIVAVLALTTGALAPTGALAATSAGSHWSMQRTRFVTVWNCAHEKSTMPVLPPSTLTGGWDSNGSAHACAAHRGGPAMDSYAQASAQVFLTQPVTLTPADRGVRFGWNLSIAMATKASYGSTVNGCPFNKTTDVFTNASGSYIYSFDYQWCDVLAVASVTATVELVDATTGKVFASANSWKGLHLASGQETITYGWFGNYTNRTYWSSNYTYWDSLNYTFGASSSIGAKFTPEWWVNGTFNASHRYLLETDLNSSMAVESFMYNAGKAAATFTGFSGTKRYEDPGPVVIY